MSQNMEETYELGDSVLLKRQFFDNNGSGLYDPDTIILRTKDPVGNVETRTPLDNASVGNYSFEFVALTEGEWAYEWKAESAAHGDTIHGGKFTVQASVIDSPSDSLVARLVQSLMPRTWVALRNADFYGEALLTQRVQIAKYTALPNTLAEADESTYSPLMREYIATLAAIEIVPAGIEYWMSEKIAVSTTGTQETVSYTDRQLALLKSLLPQLIRKAAMLAANPNIISITGSVGDAPAISGNDTGLITADPFEFPEAFDIAGNAL